MGSRVRSSRIKVYNSNVLTPYVRSFVFVPCVVIGLAGMIWISSKNDVNFLLKIQLASKAH